MPKSHTTSSNLRDACSETPNSLILPRSKHFVRDRNNSFRLKGARFYNDGFFRTAEDTRQINELRSLRGINPYARKKDVSSDNIHCKNAETELS